MKRLQNKIAESSLTLPTATLVAMLSVVVGLAGTLPTFEQWVSLACMGISAYMMVELSNGNALIRVRNRMVTSTFLLLSMAGGFIIGHVPAMLTQLFFIAALLVLFTTYQDKQSEGRVFYAFMLLGFASCTFVQSFMLIPVLWILMATQLQSLTLRSWFASLFGLTMPYWLMLPWLVLGQNFAPWVTHFQRLVTFGPLFDFSAVTVSQAAIYLFTLILSVMGIIHFWNRSYEDKIRIRLLYGFFTTMTLVCMVFILLQPQHYATLMRLTLVFASPLIAHFLVLTSSKITNIVFVLAIVTTVAITIVNQLHL